MDITNLYRILNHEYVQIVRDKIVVFSGYSDDIPFHYMDKWVDTIEHFDAGITINIR